ncbi:MAG: amino acid ABC transporter substrate-binding protein [Deltaproteobacteria bacterium]|nr:amino acid ABC transporter substrate-binding protein [Deltaproteobacteria bacterium]
MTAVLLLTTALLFACGREPETPPLRETGYRYVGLVAPLNGPLATLGLSLRQGAESALNAANAALAKGDRPFKLLVEDETAATPDSRRLAADPRVLVMVGHVMEKSLEKALPLYMKLGRPVLLPIIADDRAVEIGEGLFYRMGASYGDQARILAKYALDRLAAKSAAIVRDDSKFGRDLAQAFTQTWKADNRPGLREIVFSKATSGDGDQLELLIKDKPEVVFLALPSGSATEVIHYLSLAKIKTTLLGSQALASADIVALLTHQPFKTFLCLPLPSDDNREDRAAFLAEYDRNHHHPPDWLTILGYDAVRLALAVIAGGGNNPEGLRQYLDQLSGPDHSFHGLAGDYWFRAKGQGQTPLYVVQVTLSLLDRVPSL